MNSIPPPICFRSCPCIFCAFSAEFVCTAATPPPSVAPDVQYSFSLVAWLHTSPGVVRLGSQSTALITDVIASPAKRYQLQASLPASRSLKPSSANWLHYCPPAEDQITASGGEAIGQCRAIILHMNWWGYFPHWCQEFSPSISCTCVQYHFGSIVYLDKTIWRALNLVQNAILFSLKSTLWTIFSISIPLNILCCKMCHE